MKTPVVVKRKMSAKMVLVFSVKIKKVKSANPQTTRYRAIAAL